MDWSEEVRARLDQASRGRAELRFCLPVQASDLQAALGEIERQDGLLLEWADKWQESQAEVERLRKERDEAGHVTCLAVVNDQRLRAERAEAALEDRALEHRRAMSAWIEERKRAINLDAVLRGLLTALDAVRKDLGAQYPALSEASVLARAALAEDGK